MDTNIHSEWAQNHAGAYRQMFSEDLITAWDLSLQHGVNPFLSAIPRSGQVDARQAKQASASIYSYASRVVWLVQQYFHNCPKLGFALFNQDALLLKLFGEHPFLSWAEEQGILPLSDWSLEKLGANAVSLGLLHKKPASLVGAQNFCQLLTGTAIYFAPLLLQNGADSEPQPSGGLAILMPAEDQRSDYLGTAVTMTYDVGVHLFMSASLHSMYEKEQRGFLNIDKSMKTGTYSIAYNNQNICDIFQIPACDLAFKRVEYLFDPLPENEEFWEILRENREVKDLLIPLTVQGRRSNYSISSEVYCQRSLGLQGIRVEITLPNQIAAQVSKRIGHNAQFTFDKIIGTSSQFLATKGAACRIARSDSNVLLLGESGVGKDIFAQAIHNASARQNKPFISVNSAALPRDLIASELFGYDAGAFTGSKKNGHIGKFELANEGTIFLDEIGDMPLDLQAMLLHVIESKCFTRLGGNQVVHVNVKIISATNANLMELVRQKKFRLDLYYRLSVLTLTIPPLRERRNDVVLLAHHFLNSVCTRLQLNEKPSLSKQAEEYLRSLPWQGNVRELQNVIEGVIQIQSVQQIEVEHIRNYLSLSAPDKERTASVHPSAPSLPSLPHTQEKKLRPTREALLAALERNQYQRGATADYLGISRKTLYRWLKQYDI